MPVVQFLLYIDDTIDRDVTFLRVKAKVMKVTNKRNIATTESRMLCGILGVVRRDHIRNEEI